VLNFLNSGNRHCFISESYISINLELVNKQLRLKIELNLRGTFKLSNPDCLLCLEVQGAAAKQKSPIIVPQLSFFFEPTQFADYEGAFHKLRFPFKGR